MTNFRDDLASMFEKTLYRMVSGYEKQRIPVKNRQFRTEIAVKIIKKAVAKKRLFCGIISVSG